MNRFLEKYINDLMMLSGVSTCIDPYFHFERDIFNNNFSALLRENYKKLKIILTSLNGYDSVENSSIFFFDKKKYSFSEELKISKTPIEDFSVESPIVKKMLKTKSVVIDNGVVLSPIFLKGVVFAFLYFRSNRNDIKGLSKTFSYLLTSELESMVEKIDLSKFVSFSNLISGFFNETLKYWENKDLFKYVSKKLYKVFRSDRITIFSYDFRGNKTIIEHVLGSKPLYKRGMKIDGFNNIQIVSIDSKESVFFDLSLNETVYSKNINDPLDIKSVILIPLISRDRVSGGIFLEYTSSPYIPFKMELLNNIGEVVGQFMDRNIMYKNMKDMATTDFLTNLLLKREFIKLLSNEVERSNRMGNNLSLLMIDVDKFKLINDNYTHLAGDHVLRTVAVIIKKSIRKIDIAGRYAGDEFCVVLYNTDIKQAVFTAERIRKNVEDMPIFYKGVKLNVTLSIGVSSLEKDDSDYNDLILRADLAMYEGRKGGKRNIVNALLNC
ncbi:MAG: hypothetical protein CR982_03230 [Candidatus Cloacimonadota bacterium]|nr:MAG: hypothetical protein CR982_03230 [Candidatus Cloacimonadota bacterium]PIE77412.1 MAG: hypothetical protein CSA15_13100 [Candidatus Delongbacteria bacterium]